MNRRGFLSGFGFAGAVGMAAPALAIAKESAQPSAPNLGFMYRTVCPNPACAVALDQYVALSGPVNLGNQCPHCLYVLDFSGLSDQIADYMRKNSVWNGYTRRLA